MHEPAGDGSGSRRGPWRQLARDAWSYFWPRLHYLPLLMLLSVSLHTWGGDFVRELREYFPHEAAQTLMFEYFTEGALPAGTGERVAVIEVAARARALELEQDPSQLHDDEIDRVGGVRPIDRDKLAAFLQALAARLETIAPLEGGRTRTIAIDVDVAPLRRRVDTGGGCAQFPGEAMTAAIDALRAHADVVLVVFSRPRDDCRRQRNAYFVDALKCTLPGVADGAGRGALYLASPRLFGAADGRLPLTFPRRRLSGTVPLADAPWVPTLGNLLALQPPLKRRLDAGERHSLTELCAAARATLVRPGDGAALFDDHFEDCIAVGAGCRQVDRALRAEQARIRWHELGLVARTQLRSVSDLCPGSATTCSKFALDDRWLRGPRIVLGIDGGARFDKFRTAGTADLSIGGAQLHALIGLSAMKDPESTDSRLPEVLIDGLIGALFAVALWLTTRALDRLLPGRPLAWALLVVAGTFVLTQAFEAAIDGAVSQWMLWHAWWPAPALVMLGLVAGELLDAAPRPRDAGTAGDVAPTDGRSAAGERSGPDFSFGLVEARGGMARAPVTVGLNCLAQWVVLLAGVYALMLERPRDASIELAALALATGCTLARQRPTEGSTG